MIIIIRKNIFACLFSVHNTISLSRHEQVCLMRLRFERCFSHHRAYKYLHLHLIITSKKYSKTSMIIIDDNNYIESI